MLSDDCLKPLTVNGVLAAMHDMEMRFNGFDTEVQAFTGPITDNAEIVLMVAGQMLGNPISTLVAAITLGDHIKKDGLAPARCRLALVDTAIDQVETAMQEDLSLDMGLNNSRLAHALTILSRRHFGGIVDPDRPLKSLSLYSDAYSMMLLKGLSLAQFEHEWCRGEIPPGINACTAYTQLLKRIGENRGQTAVNRMIARDAGCLPTGLSTQLELTIALTSVLVGVGNPADMTRWIKVWLSSNSNPRRGLRRLQGLWSIMTMLGDLDDSLSDNAARQGLMEIFEKLIRELYSENQAVMDFLASGDWRSSVGDYTKAEDWEEFVA